jgi:hypothetical protein
LVRSRFEVGYELRRSSLVDVSPDLDGFRRSGWRATCEFAGAIAPDGARRFGCEISFPERSPIQPGESTEAELRFWADQPELVPGLGMRILEGHREVATGTVQEVKPE